MPRTAGHGQSISKGMDVNRMMAEFLGKSTGVCKGKGGCMHIADVSAGNLGANGIVGGGIPIAVGAALSTAMQKIDRVVVCFFGDGASNEGTFHESLNLASIWKLPIVFVCVNNCYGMSMHVKRHMNIPDIAVRAASYGIPGRSDGRQRHHSPSTRRRGKRARTRARTDPPARAEHLPHHGPLQERRGPVSHEGGSREVEDAGPHRQDAGALS